MIGVERTKEIFNEAYKDNNLQLVLSGGKSQLARIGKNEVYQNILNKEYTINATVAKGQKVGVSSCNRFDKASIAEAIKSASQIADLQKEDPDFRGFYTNNDSIIDEQFYHKQTMDFAFDSKLEELKSIFTDARAKDVEVAGAFSHGDSVYAIGNSLGLFHYYTKTEADFTLSIMTQNGGTGWAEYHSNKLDDISPRELYEVALEKALKSQNPITLDEGEYTVILEPAAVGSIIFWLGYMGFGGLAFYENRSFFSGKEGKKVFGSNISFFDDYSLKSSFGQPFDFEGMPKQKVNLVENGVFIKPVLDRNIAQKLNRESSGHALPYPSEVGPIPLNLSMQPGDQSISEMVKSTKKGVLVTRFFYDNIIDPQKLTLTGMTRDGTFLIEDGKLTKGLHNMRYNICIPEILNRVMAISNDSFSLVDFGRMSLPALKIDKFRFTGSSN